MSKFSEVQKPAREFSHGLALKIHSSFFREKVLEIVAIIDNIRKLESLQGIKM